MADRYWVGGTAAWDGTAGTKWATSSGGLGGASVPTSADDVFFTNLSTGTCTISTGNTGAKSINCTGFTGTIAGTAAITVAGSVTLVAGMTYTYTGTLTISATATLTSGGKTHGSITLSAGTLTLGDACTLGATNTFTLTAGTIELNGFTLSTGIFSSSNSNTRSITFGSANIALTSTTASTTVLSMATATGFTMTTSGGGFTRNMAATATLTFGTTGGTVSNAPNMSFTAGSSQISITPNSWFKNLNFTGNISSTTGSGTINIAGDLTLAASGAYVALIPTFHASGTITSNGATLGGNITINGAGITITLAGALTSGGLSFTLTQGTLDLANNTLTVGTFVSNNSNTRSISFGSGNIVCTNTTPGIVIVNVSTATNFTYTGTGGFRRNSTTTSSVAFGSTAGGTASNAPNFTVTGGTSAITLTGSHLKNVNLSGFTGGTGTGAAVNIYGNLTLGGGHSFTSLEPTFRASGTFTASGSTCGFVTINGAGITVTLGSAASVSSAGALTLTQGTLDLAGFTFNTGSFSSTNSNTRSIAFGSGNIALTSTTASTVVLSMATATNFTWTGTGGFTRNMAATATVRFGSSAGGFSSNAPNLTVNAGASNLTITTYSLFKNVNFTGSSSSVSGLFYVYGDLTVATGGTYTGLSPIFSSSTTFTSLGKTLSAININGSGITVALGDALTLSGTLTLSLGTFDASNFDVTAQTFLSSSGAVRTLNMGSGTWTITGVGTTWSVDQTTNITLNANTSTINMTGTAAKAFDGGDKTYYNLNQGGIGSLEIRRSNTFNSLTNSVQPVTITFAAFETQTVSNFNLAGTAGNLVTIDSNLAGSQATLSKASGVVNANYLSIKDSNATGGAVWNALLSNGNVDNGNNTGWIFFSRGNMFLLFG